MLDNICTSGKQPDFFSTMSLPISFFPIHFDIFLLLILKVEKKENIPISMKGLGFVKKVKEALKSSTPTNVHGWWHINSNN